MTRRCQYLVFVAGLALALGLAANVNGQPDPGPDVKITGTVREAAGAPVAGAMVSFSTILGFHDEDATTEAKTDAGGRYEITLPANYLLDLMPFGNSHGF